MSASSYGSYIMCRGLQWKVISGPVNFQLKLGIELLSGQKILGAGLVSISELGKDRN